MPRTQRKQQTDSRLSCGKKGRTISSVFNYSKLSYASFERNGEELLGFDRELHGELVDDFLGITSDDEIDSVFHGNTALLTVEELIFGNLRSRGFVLYNRVIVVYVNVGEGVGSASGTEQQGVARGIVARSVGFLCHAHQSTIGVLALSCRDTLGNDGRTGVGGKVDHLRSCVCLLEVVGDSH